MADRRIRVARDKESIIRRLLAAEASTGPFRLIAEVIAFAAAVGASKELRVPLGELSKEFEPIRRSVFDSRGYDTLINLLAINAVKSPTVLAASDSAEESRASVLEEYANGGLQILEQDLRGSVDILDALVLMLQAEETRKDGTGADDFDLTSLIR